MWDWKELYDCLLREANLEDFKELYKALLAYSSGDENPNEEKLNEVINYYFDDDNITSFVNEQLIDKYFEKSIDKK